MDLRLCCSPALVKGLFVPYFDNEDTQQCGVAARWNLDTLLQVLRNMLAYKGEEFSDV